MKWYVYGPKSMTQWAGRVSFEEGAHSGLYYKYWPDQERVCDVFYSPSDLISFCEAQIWKEVPEDPDLEMDIGL